MKKSLTHQLKEKKDRIKELEKQLEEITDDRRKFREYWAQKMKWFIKLHGEGSSPGMPWLLEDMAKFFNRVETWYW